MRSSAAAPATLHAQRVRPLHDERLRLRDVRVVLALARRTRLSRADLPRRSGAPERDPVAGRARARRSRAHRGRPPPGRLDARGGARAPPPQARSAACTPYCRPSSPLAELLAGAPARPLARAAAARLAEQPARKGDPMRKAVVMAAVTAGALAFVPAAFGHAAMSPPVAKANVDQQFTLSVPTEEEGATTTRIELTLPEGFSIDSFEPAPGWKREEQATGSAAEKTIQKVTWSGGKVPTDEDAVFRFNGSIHSSRKY